MGSEPLPAEPNETRELIRYGAPRAPAALLSQLLFWTDYSCSRRSATSASAELGVYAAAVRVAQAIALFLIAANYMFSPFVADLHARGERQRLDGLYKALTRWTFAGTIPILLLLLVVPGAILQIFGSSSFASGEDGATDPARRRAVNVAVGSVGFILIMVGRTGWDLLVYVGSFLLDLTLALVLAPKFGANGAAVAQSVTLAVTNAVRLFLVWRFVRIQPFSRAYARLLIPAVIGLLAMIGTNAVLSGAAWQVDLIVTGLVGLVIYVPALIAFGLTPGERRCSGARRASGAVTLIGRWPAAAPRPRPRQRRRRAPRDRGWVRLPSGPCAPPTCPGRRRGPRS